ncbi:hypothetical protein BREVNS_0341 [Brevinematales bacterium NS]|nr:hypothetical protein BREVNS_0341 [Brevinematales bacterium NS]
MAPSDDSFYGIGCFSPRLECLFRLDDSQEEYVYFMQKFKKKE